MSLGKPASFILQTVTVALAAVIVILFLKPELLQREPTVVQFHETAGQIQPDSQGAIPSGGPVSYAAAVKSGAPAVVNIYTTKVITERVNPLLQDPFFQRFFGDSLRSAPRKRLETSLGSGVIMSPQGFILTNNHVINNADTIQVQLHDGRHAEASVVGIDPETDLAVLRIDLRDLPSVTIGRSDSLQVGDVVLAIGNPFGVGQTVTMGIVSATGRSQLGINTFENFIQTDAAINPGNSGGALINPQGHLIGINTAIFSRTGGYQGIGFAIPVNLAKDVMQQIFEYGHVVRGWLGVEAQDITPELAESFNLGDTRGVIIAGILRGGPADRAGLQPGDVITRISGEPVGDSRALLNIITRTRPDSGIRLSVFRAGKSIELTATVAERPQPKPAG